ncbi:hypothetical protein [Microcystis sp. M158S2]|nr:hypothetical protein [Microcystis sp. M158S2]MCA2735186.1 hypothetical protein [Microcystis sp. M158S2]MCA2761991.1 hypothetical protein [Microcystis sp. M151S2]MCA6537780.1 hypothetical protein [Pseudanabaena sp. M037S2SP2A07QC]MCA6623054.1 hypothetical protein [Pseudanabaena sp. M165S2SP1A06QC]
MRSLSKASINIYSGDFVPSIPPILEPLAIALEPLSSSAIAIFLLIKL